MGHGGWTSAPSSILDFAHDPTYVPRAQQIAIPLDALAGYLQFFFFDYLPSVYEDYFTKSFAPRDLLERLKEDTSCCEILSFSENVTQGKLS